MKFTVSILAYGRLELTRKCVESVLKHSEDVEIVLTNNASTDGVKEYFDSVQPGHGQSVRVIHNATNEGFIEPNRRALAMASGEFFILLNNDCTVPPAWLRILAEPFAQFSTAALTGPAGNCCQILPNFHGTGGNNFEYLEGSCLMGRTETLRKHGLFDPNLHFAYGEDSDLSLRMRELGYTLHRVNLVVPHARGATSRTVPGIAAIEEKNLAYLRTKWVNYLKTRRMNYPIIVKRRAAFGDVLNITPILRGLRAKYPACPIWVQTHCGDILKGNPLIAKLDTKFVPPPDAVVIDLDMAYENTTRTHYVDAYAAKAGVKVERRCDLYPTKEDAAWADRVIPGGPWVAIHTGPTSWASRNWTNDRWQKVISALPINVVMVGHDTHQFTAGAGRQLVYARGSYMQVAAVLARAVLFIGVDSLPIHMAQAMGTPVIGLFGVTLPEFVLADNTPWTACRADRTAPGYGMRHNITGKNIVDDPNHCMLTITPEQVIEAFHKHHVTNSSTVAIA